jgi:hypothetical protein
MRSRLRNVVRRLHQGLAPLGFERAKGCLAIGGSDDVVWVLDLALAPWSRPERVCATLGWSVHVPGMGDVFGDPDPPVSGRLGAHRGLDPQWVELHPRPSLVAAVEDARAAARLLDGFHAEVLPALERLATAADVQRHLHATLLDVPRGAPTEDELRTIRRIAALSVVMGERQNAARWLDHLEARSAAAMAPDIVHERVDDLRRQALAS